MQPGQGPVILLLKGHPCCGKSTLADALSRRLLWAVVDKDDGRDCLSKLDSVPRSELNELAYHILFQIASRQVLLVSSDYSLGTGQCCLLLVN